MTENTTTTPPPAEAKKAQPNLLTLLKPYTKLIGLLVLLAIGSNVLTLAVPRMISLGIDAYAHGTFALAPTMWAFGSVAFFIFVLTYLQSMVQTYASEKVARDLRDELAAKISRQSYATVTQLTPSRLLTNLTSDIDAVKMFISLAIVSLVSSLILIVGSTILLLSIHWKLGLAVLSIVPVIGGTFFYVFSKVRVLFKKGQEIIDWLNKVINESILGAGLIRVLHSQHREFDKFLAANTAATDTGMKVLRLFAALIPVITFVSNMAAVIILALGGHFVIAGSLSIGAFAAFNGYLSILIFPIIIIGFMSTVIARASASYARVSEVLTAPDPQARGTVRETIRGDVDVKDVTVNYGEKAALKHVSFGAKAGTRTAIIGPTAAGKSQLLYLLTGLTRPSEGVVEFDGRPLESYDPASLHQQVGFVFQDSVIFNMTLRENIAFSEKVTDETMQRAIDTAELHDFIAALPEGLETVVSERGTSLSGGQKQRIMLARALALNPRILLLDDFTARVDNATEKRILENVRKNYPGITLISVTQKISSIEDYDQVILLMEGEVLAAGTHEQLIHSSPEYAQIFQSQRSTNAYELRTE